MNTITAFSNLKRYTDLVFLLVANGKDGRVYRHAPTLATALNAAISAYHGSPLERPCGKPASEETIQAVHCAVRGLKQNGVPFVLAWYVPCDEVARMDCSGDINVRQELIDCLTDELQDVFTF